MTSGRLLFLSTRFLFPADSGGKIRTVQILRGLKGGRFEVVLLSPAPADWKENFGADVDRVADRFISWRESGPSFRQGLRKAASLFSRVPVPVATDRSAPAQRALAAAIAETKPDVLVVDFPHAAVLLPPTIDVPSVMFTHNVEAEIFARHVAVARDPVRRAIWRQQHRKMERYERETLARFDAVIAVSERDRDYFESGYGLKNAAVIPTGVDLEYFAYREVPRGHEVVFTGSMDWLANQDGIEFFMDDVWPRIVERVPDARMNVVGRAPPPRLVQRAAAKGLAWTFSGFVNDVREHIHRASAYVIPLRVGGGTRIKAYEAMASGCPVVSTAIGVEGLPLEDGTHYMRADTAEDFAARVCDLLERHDRALEISRRARELVEREFSFVVAARAFERICAGAAAARPAR